MLLWTLPLSSPAETTTEKNAATCFCLIDEDKNFYYHCDQQTQRLGQLVYLCRDDQGQPYKHEVGKNLTIIEAGSDPCDPCQLPLETIERIRGNDDQQKEKSNVSGQ